MGNYLRLVCSVVFGIFYCRWHFPRRELLKSVIAVAKGEPLNDHNWALLLTKNLPGSGCTGKMRWCPGRHQGCCTWQECQFWNNTKNGSQTPLWNLLSPYFRAILFSCIKYLFLGNQSCDWDQTLQRIPHIPEEFLPQALLTLLLLPKHRKHTNIIFSH